MQLKILGPNDAEAYRELRLYSFQEAPFAFSESYEDEKGRPLSYYEQLLLPEGNPPERYVLGAFSDTNKLIGIATFRRDQRSKALHKAMVYAMYVHPEYRGKHVGHELMSEIIRRAKQMPGMEAIHLWVLHADTSAAPFYQQLGFESQGKVNNDLKVGDQYIDAEYMLKYL
jgi:ribosomal protein S18 acetylase RimI-like enzyme